MPVLLLVLAISVLCLIESAVPAALAAVLAVMAAIYTWLCIKRINSTEAFELVLAVDGQLSLQQAGIRVRLEAVRWQDFGYLAVLRCRCQGKPAVYFWWCHFLPSDQRHVLWRMMNASAIGKLEKPPSLIVNPLL